ncbi:MAG: hypothetical protein AAF985_12120 [Bacteroidota bacterium]
MRKKLFITLCCFSLLLSACKKDNQENEEFEETIDQPTEPGPGGSVQDINVPDGFTYSVTTPVELNMTYIDQTSSATKKVFYTIMGKPEGTDPEELLTGSSGDRSQVNLKLSIPNHYKDIVIKTNWDGNVKYFDFPVQSIINAELVVNGFNSNAGDTRSNNCYPSISNTFLPDDTGFSISSDQVMKTIEIIYTDGTSETITVNASSYIY